jgi:cytochrome c oxidase accessory protein FixG
VIAQPPKPSEPSKQPDSPLKKVDWQDFREHLATADQQGRRMWLYPRKPRGSWFNARRGLAVALLAIMFAGPFVRIHGNPLLMINIVERRFSILGHVFWPQDMFLFALAVLLFLTGIVVFTAAFGRLWCGWACPQTVLMEMVFRPIEWLIEGHGQSQRRFDKAPASFKKVARKLLKHGIFLGLSFVIGNTLLAYIIGTDELFKIIKDPPHQHFVGLTFMVLFTLVFYGIFARFREQACTFICPYGRFQSTLLDENSLIVAYNAKRGERRGKYSRGLTWDQRREAGGGDCVACNACVDVCPTGIDIRNGLQMECVHCTACIDACNHVMSRLGRPKDLIGYNSLNNLERGQHFGITPRIAGYCGILAVLTVLFAVLLYTRADVQATLLRAQGAIFQKMPNGKLSNLYTVKLVNKASHLVPVELRLEQPEGKLTVLGHRLDVPSEKLVEASVLIELDPAQVKGGKASLQIGVWSGDKKLQTVKSVFIGPRTEDVAN